MISPLCKSTVTISFLLIALHKLVFSNVFACGYHSPELIRLGSLNLTFPKALYVRSAVWDAEVAGILPRSKQPENNTASSSFPRVQLALEILGARLSNASQHINGPSGIAIVLIDSVMWTRFVETSDGYETNIHTDGPESNDIVIVSSSEVVLAMTRGTLDSQTAEDTGLIRIYRHDSNQDSLRELLQLATYPGQVEK